MLLPNIPVLFLEDNTVIVLFILQIFWLFIPLESSLL